MPLSPPDAPPVAAPGPSEEPFPNLARRSAGPSTRQAFVVLGIAFLVLLGGGIAAALTSSGSAAPPATRSLRTAAGATITAVPGGHALAVIVTAGSPPGDILDAVALPRGAAVTAGSARDNGIGLYDHSLSFSIGQAEQRVIDFFRAEMPALKWQVVSQGPPPHGTPGFRIVGQHPGSDGYEWEMGVTVAPTTFTTSAAKPADTTSFTIRLFAVTDD
ncbi:MAG: hypothetical protein ACRDY1_08865 [Acidimicrobiales bacterium]